MADFGNSKNQSDDIPLCANNCGFYGYPKTLNLCSLCYAAFLKRTAEDSRRRSLGTGRSPSYSSESYKTSELESEPDSSDVVRSKKLGTELVEVRNEEPDHGLRRSLSTSESSETSESAAELKNPEAKTKNRCKMCKKKTGLLGFNCRCGGLFCGKHRYPEEHCCDVDHKAAGREILTKQIVECKANKLEFRV